MAGTSVKKPTPAEIAAARGRTIPDVIGPGLKVLFVGINPSLYSAAVGHHFARPGNRFWPALYAAGFSNRQLYPSEGRILLDSGYGITNIAAPATAAADELSDEELREGARRLGRKVRRYRPAVVAFLGVTAYRIAFGQPKAKLGRQSERLAESAVWVLPNPSGLNARACEESCVRIAGWVYRSTFLPYGDSLLDEALKLKAEHLASDIAAQARTLDDLNGLIRTLMKSALERILDTEMDVHLGRKAVADLSPPRRPTPARPLLPTGVMATPRRRFAASWAN